MKILLIGGGGREHAIAWKLAQSPRVNSIVVAPGNGGTSQTPKTQPQKIQNLEIAATDIAALLQYAQTNAIDLTIVGPDDPLALGIVDAFQRAGLRIFGPNQQAAKLEWSKAFAKTIMREAGVPCADFASFETLQTAQEFVKSQPFATPGFVVKADGLALGKGVIVCDDQTQAQDALVRMFGGEFGQAAKTVLIEERMHGPELSALCFCDGTHIAAMPLARDHKRAFDNDQGPNTGGMGAYAPVPNTAPETLLEINQKILLPVVTHMRERGTPYVGVLYAGLMQTQAGLRVIEFNARFGDPETQAILPLLKSDLLEVIEACIDGTLHRVTPQWHAGAAATVVMASGGYPGAYKKDLPIFGLENTPSNAMVFHAGTKQHGQETRSNGGRVLNISATGATLEEALQHAYAGIEKIGFEGAFWRSDIGQRDIGAAPAEGRGQSAEDERRGEPGVRPHNAPSLGYAAAGVNIAEGARAIELMKKSVRSTHTPEVLAGVGAFGGVLDISRARHMQRPLLVASTDGVGTKTMIAARMNDWSGIGADIVNHGINDVLVQGAQPLFFLDYIAANTLQAEWVAAIVQSMAEACRAANCVLLGGETAEMPGVYKDGESDVAGTMVGLLEHDALIDGRHVQDGDAILALPSSGLHTNGYSLARRVLHDLDWATPRDDLHGQTIGAALLAPHRSYLQDIQTLLGAGLEIRALAHITGGGLWDNIPRTLPENTQAVLWRGSWNVPAIFALIAKHGQLHELHSEHELHHAFNMGIGMTVVLPRHQLEAALRLLPEATHVGMVRTHNENAPRVVLEER